MPQFLDPRSTVLEKLQEMSKDGSPCERGAARRAACIVQSGRHERSRAYLEQMAKDIPSLKGVFACLYP